MEWITAHFSLGADTLLLALGLCVWFYAWTKAPLKALVAFVILECKIAHMSVCMLIIGLFGSLSPLSLGVCLWALFAKYRTLEIFSLRMALFLSVFGALVFLDTLELLPLGLVHGCYTTALVSLCVWSLLAFFVHKPLGVLFVFVLSLEALDKLGQGDHFPLLYTPFMDIYLWIVAVAMLVKKGILKRS